eukprot:IDg9484t1
MFRGWQRDWRAPHNFQRYARWHKTFEALAQSRMLERSTSRSVLLLAACRRCGMHEGRLCCSACVACPSLQDGQQTSSISTSRHLRELLSLLTILCDMRLRSRHFLHDNEIVRRLEFFAAAACTPPHHTYFNPSFQLNPPSPFPLSLTTPTTSACGTVVTASGRGAIETARCALSADHIT